MSEKPKEVSKDQLSMNGSGFSARTDESEQLNMDSELAEAEKKEYEQLKTEGWNLVSILEKRVVGRDDEGYEITLEDTFRIFSEKTENENPKSNKWILAEDDFLRSYRTALEGIQYNPEALVVGYQNKITDLERRHHNQQIEYKRLDDLCEDDPATYGKKRDSIQLQIQETEKRLGLLKRMTPFIRKIERLGD